MVSGVVVVPIVLRGARPAVGQNGVVPETCGPHCVPERLQPQYLLEVHEEHEEKLEQL